MHPFPLAGSVEVGNMMISDAERPGFQGTFPLKIRQCSPDFSNHFSGYILNITLRYPQTYKTVKNRKKLFINLIKGVRLHYEETSSLFLINLDAGKFEYLTIFSLSIPH
ncbi:hypothetical protein DSY1692 [Desulfitobacterium hafniense Y51]|uniref:Uncharacterized protein n=1 Tax=Desulfitobacterium hafniense (strain Y51) TaxID=138119 RepID=Q24WW1_DESHY|nr:hypothetical protein DSY1692 [Desulfitobacterium hafniense Y51]